MQALPITVARHSLVVMSNRTPTEGLVSALESALRADGGVWLGRSGRERTGESRIELQTGARPVRATFDLSPAMRDAYEAGFCTGALWPLFHGMPGRVRYSDGDWDAYVRANDCFAQHAVDLAHINATIWVHDYHLLLAARALRRAGHRGRIGLFLHVPFPSPDLFETIPWGGELLSAMLEFDLLGFQSERWANHFVAAARNAGRPTAEDGAIATRYGVTEVGVFPATIDVEAFREPRDELPEIASMRSTLGDRRLLLAVDRLDYAKGVPERLVAFERLLDRWPEWRRRVVLVQVAVPSRVEVPGYAELRHTVERLVGKINGRFGEADWVPIRYLYRSYDQAVLAQLYELADVALVTPLRDGMNLVAKEFVAAQDRTRPGVLVLSQYAGAADALLAALITNPFHPEGMAAEIDRALRMPLDERIERHRSLEAALERGGSPSTWARRFLDRLDHRAVVRA